jgi:hypothetical protein
MAPAEGDARARRPDLLHAVGELLDDLEPLGCHATLVGGMALVTLGSTRVTRDFDFLVVEGARGDPAVMQALYRHGFELVSRIDEHGEIARTIGSQKVASSRLRIDRPKAAYFYNRRIGLRVDLLFDFPMAASDVRSRSTRRTIDSHAFHIAGRDDLRQMKEVAARARWSAADLQDLEFLAKPRPR